MRSVRLGAAVVGALASVLGSSPAAWGQQAADLVGVWRLVDNVNRDTGSGETNRPFGDQPVGTYVFSSGGRLVALQFRAQRALPAGPTPTEAESSALFASMLAYSGTYRLDGGDLVVAIEQSSIQTWSGSTRRFKVDHAGSRVTMTTEPFTSIQTGRRVEAVLVLERVE